MGERQERNLAAARAFNATAGDNAARRAHFAEDFVWHVPGDNTFSGDYSRDSYFADLLVRMQHLDNWNVQMDNYAANGDLVVTVGRVRASRDDRSFDAVGGYVFRFHADGLLAEAWGWSADQVGLDAFFAGS